MGVVIETFIRLLMGIPVLRININTGPMCILY
jgi:hypothetical protein